LKLLRKILIANRGEIALRVMRTCREMGIATVAVYTDADRGAMHARQADEAVSIGRSYLDIKRVLDAARKTKAEAIHPGYGFLSENAHFAEACESAGIVFVGPPAKVIRELGSKIRARAIAEAAGVAVVPEGGTSFPVLIKASAGGGGRGMRIVRDAAEMEEALASAKREAERSFGDGTLLIEKFIENARHVEVQIFGDQLGNVIHLFERDCTTQRRYQKIIEESPCPAIVPDLRERICFAARSVMSSAGYVNAGTVEFLLAPTGEFYFIEVNTRLQVEHPVTEMVTGLDLVRMQIEVTEGRPLAVHPESNGHAIEARLYAEDPANDFLPSTGTIEAWRAPGNVRVETAIEAGTRIGLNYDPLLAKIVAHAEDRERAARKLVYALRTLEIRGVQTNRAYLIQTLEPGSPGPVQPALFRGVPYRYRNNPYTPRTTAALLTRPSPVRGNAGASSPMPGQVLRIVVTEGQKVKQGDPLVVLEAMKMEQTVRTAIDGVVKSILVKLGQVVAPGQMLVKVSAEDNV
jgi:acetyl/propionyl-CoA carboxylase alpha subunit